MSNLLRAAARAVQDRKAVDPTALNLAGVCSFTDYFLICSGTSTRHTQAICDAVLDSLEKAGVSPSHIEGYSQGEWILMDYLELVVHIFSQRAREFYALERLWKTAKTVPIGNDEW